MFSVPVTGGPPTVLASFNGSDGSDVLAGVVVSDNMIYGTTREGSGYNQGTVFSLPVTGGSPTTLATFNSSNGADPNGLVISGNTLYGTTGGGGANGCGTVFSLPVTGGILTTLASFNRSNGANPAAGLALSGNTLYGTTADGGSGYNGSAGSGGGAVFSLSVTGGPINLLASFNGSTGANPVAPLIVSGSNLYGTTGNSGPTGNGTAFQVPITGGTPIILANLSAAAGETTFSGGLALSGNTLFGTNFEGGTVYSLPATGGPLTTLVTFNGSNGSGPEGGVIFSNGILYGTTQEGGGTNVTGTVFSVTYNHTLLTAVVPANFGSLVGRLQVTGANYNFASCSFAATPTGYVNANMYFASAQTEIFALEITDSSLVNLAADLADAASEINAGSYLGYVITASTNDPSSFLSSGYDFYITISNDSVIPYGSTNPNFGFDFTGLSGTSDTLSVNAVAATFTVAVPEPAGLTFLGVAAASLLRRRRRR